MCRRPNCALRGAVQLHQQRRGEAAAFGSRLSAGAFVTDRHEHHRRRLRLLAGRVPLADHLGLGDLAHVADLRPPRIECLAHVLKLALMGGVSRQVVDLVRIGLGVVEFFDRPGRLEHQPLRAVSFPPRCSRHISCMIGWLFRYGTHSRYGSSGRQLRMYLNRWSRTARTMS